MVDEYIQRLIEKRANLWEQAKAHLDKVESEGREFTGEAQETWERMNHDLSELDARISELTEAEKRRATLEDVRAQFGDAFRAADAPGASADATGGRSDEERLRALATGESRAEEFSSHRAERRALNTGTAAAGGNLVPTSFYSQLVDFMVQNAAIRQTNVRVLTTASGNPLQVPKVTAHSTAAIVAEAAAIGASEPTFGQVTLNAFKYGYLLQVSSEMLADSGVDLESFLAMDAGRALGNATGAHFINGTGVNQPNGVLTAATIGKTGATAGGAFTTADVIDLFYSVVVPYRTRSYWLVSDAAVSALRKLTDSTGQFLWQPGLVSGEPNTLLGRPVVSDPNVPAPGSNAKSIIFGDFSAYYIRDVASVRVERSTDYAFNTDLVTFRFLGRFDGDLVDTTGAIKVFKGAA